MFTLTFGESTGTKVTYLGQLDGADRLVGAFDITAWGFIKNGVTGAWEIARIE